MFHTTGGYFTGSNVAAWLKCERSEIKEIRVYPKVLLVIFTKQARRRPQFVSKLALKPVSIQQFHKVPMQQPEQQPEQQIQPAAMPVNPEVAAALAVTNANARKPQHLQSSVRFMGVNIA